MSALKKKNRLKQANGPCLLSGKPLWMTVLLAAGFGLSFYLSYYHFWPLVFLAIVPLALLSDATPSRWTLPSVTLGVAVCWREVYYFFETFSPIGLWMICIYHGFIVALVVSAVAWLRRRTRLPLCFLFPVMWIGGEFWRMSGALGLPLGLLAPPAREQLWMIQVCDIGGLYTLSFAIAMVGALIGDLIRERSAFRAGFSWRNFRLLERAGIVTTGAIWLLIFIYGAVRLNQSETTMSVGPRLTLVQPDVPTSGGGLNGFDPNLLLDELMRLSRTEQNKSPKPDMIVWPEAPTGFPALNSDWIRNPPMESVSSVSNTLVALDLEHGRSEVFDRKIRAWVDHEGTPVLLGATARVKNESEENSNRVKYNAALRYDPGNDSSTRCQFKTRLFPMGEYIPGEGWFYYDTLKQVLDLSHPSDWDRWFEPGDGRETFRLNEHRYAVSICNEIMYPSESGVFLAWEKGRKPIDFVVNLSNNGGFQRNHAMIYHSYLLPFSAVEARIGVARSSNTGISGFVKPTGEIYGEVSNEMGQRWTGLGAPELDLIEKVVRFRFDNRVELPTNPELLAELNEMVGEVKRLRAESGVTGQSTQAVWVDSRRTLYSRFGDVLGWTCLTALLVVLVIGGGAGCWEQFHKKDA